MGQLGQASEGMEKLPADYCEIVDGITNLLITKRDAITAWLVRQLARETNEEVERHPAFSHDTVSDYADLLTRKEVLMDQLREVSKWVVSNT